MFFIVILFLSVIKFHTSNFRFKAMEKTDICHKKNKFTKTFSLFIRVKEVFTESAMALAIGGF